MIRQFLRIVSNGEEQQYSLKYLVAGRDGFGIVSEKDKLSALGLRGLISQTKRQSDVIHDLRRQRAVSNIKNRDDKPT